MVPASKLKKLMVKTVGCNNSLPSFRLLDGMDYRSPGVVELASAVNFYIDDSGLPRTRLGVSALAAGGFHSLISDGVSCFVAVDRPAGDTAIMQVQWESDTAIRLSGVRSGLSLGKQLSWTFVNGDFFYSNGVENGFIREGISYPWPDGSYVGSDTDKQFYGAPIGEHIAFKPGGFMYIAAGNVIYENYKPFEFGLYNLKSGFLMFDSRVLMIAPVYGGIFVSDENATWFFKGTGVHDFSQIKVAAYPAIEWSLASKEVTLSELGVKNLDGNARIWCGRKNICAGLPDGTLLELAADRISLGATSGKGASVITDVHQGCGNQLITTIF